MSRKRIVRDADRRPFLIDVSRLVWRVWAQRLMTGIDRVCLAYLDHFGDRAQAVLQRNGHFAILSPENSDRLFALLRQGPNASRLSLLALAAIALPAARRAPPRPNMTYLNIGHTGLNEPSLPSWVTRYRVRAVYLIHDLIPLTHPEFCRAGEADKHAQRMCNALVSASGLIGNSHATLADLRAFAQAREIAMPPCVAALLGGASLPSEAYPAKLSQPYFVTVGTIEGRKNHLLLLQIWQRLVAAQGPGAPILLVIGQRGWAAGDTLAALDRLALVDGKVRELGRCDDAAMAGWIAGARALLMPSFAEGFGIPVIEALALGTPVIASNLPVFREIAGDIPEYIDPLDQAGWEQAICAFSGDDPARSRQLALMADYRAPDWKGHFAVVEAWLQASRMTSVPTTPGLHPESIESAG